MTPGTRAPQPRRRAVLERLLLADLLKALSASTVVTLSSLVLVVPVLIVTLSGGGDGVGGLSAAAATRVLLGIGAAGALGCGFYGSYLVTRDHYYRAMDRAFLLAPPGVVFTSRLLAAAAVGAAFSLVGSLAWGVISVVVLAQQGVAATFGVDSALIIAGTVVAGTLAAVIGCGAGWVIRNYYASVVLLLVLPAIVATPLLSRQREIERFLPIGAAAGLGGVQLDGLLPPPVAGLVLAGWAALAVTAGWLVLRRHGMRS